MKKVLLVTFSDNADHQDTLFGMYEEMRKRSDWDAYLLCIKTPKVELQQSDHAWLVDCPERPGVTKKTFNLPLLLSIVHRIRRGRFDAIYFESLHTWNLNNDYVTDAEMRATFINCDWTIVPYNSASQSGIIIDAYKYSRPVIAFAVGAIPEQVDDGKSGYLVEAGDNQKFAAKLKEVMQLSAAQYDAMSRDAYQYGSKKYATSGAVERFVELLNDKI